MKIAIWLILLPILLYIIVCAIKYAYEEICSSIKKLKADVRQGIWDLEWKWKLWRERMEMEVYDVVNVHGHYEVYVNGNFICSGDTYGEAVREAKSALPKGKWGEGK